MSNSQNLCLCVFRERRPFFNTICGILVVLGFFQPTLVKRKKTLVLYSDAARSRYHFYASICGMWWKACGSFNKTWSLSEEEIKKKIDAAVLLENSALLRLSLPLASEADAWNYAKTGANRHLLQANSQAIRMTLWSNLQKTEEVWRMYRRLAESAKECFKKAIRADEEAEANFGIFNPTVKPFLKKRILKIMKKKRRQEERRLARERRA